MPGPHPLEFRRDAVELARAIDEHGKRLKPIAQIGFMPEALSSKPQPYKHNWSPGEKYGTIYTGWAYPPKDYEKFAKLVCEWVKHSVDRYGRKEVETWHWELWNEPNIGYWQGTTEEYIKMYDYVSAAVKKALPTAMIGGPETTGPASEKAAQFLKTFLDHIVSGKNHVTGKTGAPLDFEAAPPAEFFGSPKSDRAKLFLSQILGH